MGSPSSFTHLNSAAITGIAFAVDMSIAVSQHLSERVLIERGLLYVLAMRLLCRPYGYGI